VRRRPREIAAASNAVADDSRWGQELSWNRFSFVELAFASGTKAARLGELFSGQSLCILSSRRMLRAAGPFIRSGNSCRLIEVEDGQSGDFASSAN
jgi:hypothetical protein